MNRFSSKIMSKNNFFIIIIISFIFSIQIFISHANAASLIYNEDFETSDWTKYIKNAERSVRTTNAPHSGKYCLRTSQKTDREDPIMGIIGGWPFPLFVGAGDIASKTPNEMYFRSWFRHDDYDNPDWKNISGQKLFYMVDDGPGGFNYLVGSNQLSAYDLTLTYCNDSKKIYCNYDWAIVNWGGRDTLTLHNDKVIPSTRGIWRHLEFYINYKEKYIMIWIDGYLLTDTKGLFPNGQIPYAYPLAEKMGDPYHIESISLIYGPSGMFLNTIDRTGYGGGFQLDDIEVWDGVPPDAHSIPSDPILIPEPSKIPNPPLNISID